MKKHTLSLTFKPYTLELKYVFTVASNSRISTPIMLTEFEYDGITGYGETSMPPYLGETKDTVEKFLKKVDLSSYHYPFDLETILADVDAIAPYNTAAKASIDIALHDLTGKIVQKPWYKIWNFNPQTLPQTSFTVGIDSPEMVIQKTKEALPYNILKVKVSQDTDKKMIRAVRIVTDKPLFVDVNQGWSDKYYALDMIFWLQERGVIFIEQPLPRHQVNDLAWLTRQSPIPIFADEGIQRLEDMEKIKDVYSGINIKLMKCTGMHEARKIIAMAKTMGMKTMMGCMTETSCAISAAAHLAPACDYADLDGSLLITNDLFDGIKIENGNILLNDRPGIGVIKLTNLLLP